MSRGNPYDYCPECNSQNTERSQTYNEYDCTVTTKIKCHHCKNKFRLINGQWVKEEV